MADCVSLPNAAELVEELRRCADEGFFAPCEMENAADAIEALIAANASLKSERDAAVADIPRACGYCKWYVESDDECIRMFPCNSISGVNTGWEWRGVQDA